MNTLVIIAIGCAVCVLAWMFLFRRSNAYIDVKKHQLKQEKKTYKELKKKAKKYEDKAKAGTDGDLPGYINRNRAGRRRKPT
jgi:Tfp pilus assembly protein PilO